MALSAREVECCADAVGGDEAELADRGGVACAGDENSAEPPERRLARVFQNSSRIRRLLSWQSVARKPALLLLQRAPALTTMLVRMTR